ncbi:transcription termination factor Rho [Corynebacterium pseudotuberculosis 31]|nr:transcription termination factor Rho [Corynebacterium pseudotuberculosis 31]
MTSFTSGKGDERTSVTTTDNGAQRNLAALRLPELRKIAAEMGLKGTSALRKGDLIAAISGAQGGKAAQSGHSAAPAAKRNARAQAAPKAEKDSAPVENSVPEVSKEQQEKADQVPAKESKSRRRRVLKTTGAMDSAHETASSEPISQESSLAEEEKPRRRRVTRRVEVSSEKRDPAENSPQDKTDTPSESNDGVARVSENGDAEDENRYESRSAARRARRNRARREHREDRQTSQREDNHAEGDRSSNDEEQRKEASVDNVKTTGRREAPEQQAADQPQTRETREGSENEHPRQRNGRHHERGERGDRNRRNRRNRRGRDRDDHRDNSNIEPREDEVLQNIAGILDIVDSNVAFVRTSGYHAGSADVYVNNQMIRRLGLRAGDAITGQVRMNGDNNHGGHHGHNRGRNRQKYNPLVRVESVNGMSVEEAKARPDFSKLTPLYPNQRLRLETEPKILTTRVIDLIMPIGKGQRALIVSPPKAGKTTILQNIANAIATNNPECYLMVVLVDERPEEVTDMQRSVKGEVIASTFDRPPSEHTAVAELAIERAKRLVEQGQDVVVLLDSITRLGRAYNNSSPASGRILSGGVDSNALYPPKRFLGAARNIENGGSLTIIATAMVETGSAGDTVIFEEFKGTGNAELKLDRKISERRVFPAVDVNPSGTRKDELLLVPEEARIMHKLRRILAALENQQAIDLLIKQLKKTKSNGEFLMQIASSAPMAADAEEE